MQYQPLALAALLTTRSFVCPAGLTVVNQAISQVENRWCNRDDFTNYAGGPFVGYVLT